MIREITDIAMELLEELWKPPSPIRALTVTAIYLTTEDAAYEQEDLFAAAAAPKKEKQEKLEAAMDRIRGKYGNSAIVFGAASGEKEEDPFS